MFRIRGDEAQLERNLVSEKTAMRAWKHDTLRRFSDRDPIHHHRRPLRHRFDQKRVFAIRQITVRGLSLFVGFR